MIICVVATASALRGALMIYKQFVNELACDNGHDHWHIFVDNNMPMPKIENVTYHICHTKGFGRVWFDLLGFKKKCDQIGIAPDVIFSLQNTGVKCKTKRTVIYYHQPLPLYQSMLGFSPKYVKERIFSILYPLYVKWFIDSNTYVAVQTNTVRDLFSKRFGFPLEKVGVFFPHIEKININEVSSYDYEKGTYNFIYPAMNAPYKEHQTLAFAMRKLYEKNPSLALSIRIHLTIENKETKDVYQFIRASGLERNFIFHGNLTHDQVLAMYKNCSGLLFPSVIETLGLPLLEAASFGIPIVANDMGYVHDVVGDYVGVNYVKVHDYAAWAVNIITCCASPQILQPFNFSHDNSWKRLFELIRYGNQLIPPSE